jgi:hypothetical protein
LLSLKFLFILIIGKILYLKMIAWGRIHPGHFSSLCPDWMEIPVEKSGEICTLFPQISEGLLLKFLK